MNWGFWGPFSDRTIKVPDEELERMLAQWPYPLRAEYRFPKCWGCGRTLWLGCWHVFFRKNEREAHLCRKCGEPYEV
jgi:hypothetical protein